MICSVREVPERGIPTTKTGFDEGEPPAAIFDIASRE